MNLDKYHNMVNKHCLIIWLTKIMKLTIQLIYILSNIWIGFQTITNNKILKRKEDKILNIFNYDHYQLAIILFEKKMK